MSCSNLGENLSCLVVHDTDVESQKLLLDWQKYDAALLLVRAKVSYILKTSLSEFLCILSEFLNAERDHLIKNRNPWV